MMWMWLSQAGRWPGWKRPVPPLSREHRFCWWIHAHTKDDRWSVGSDIREAWAAEINQRTPLSAADLVDGAVDVEWFNRVWAQLKRARWEKLDDAAKYASGGGGHKRAQLFADAMLGRAKKAELIGRINDKRNQDAVRALGLLPLARGKSRQVPLGPVPPEALPESVRAMRPWVESGYPLRGLSDVRTACVDWLKSLYVAAENP